MSTLVWDQVGDRKYEAGVSKGVLYNSERRGIPWNGLTSIDESVQTQVEPVYFDGVKFNNVINVGDFEATLRAFTYPEEFLEHEGILEEQMGFYITSQPPSPFGLSYRTETGDDISNLAAGYKLHVLYNLTAIPAQKSYQTLGSNVDPMEFEWAITSIPEQIDKFRPTAHVIFDSRRLDPYLLLDIEAILYGSETNEAYLPSLKSLASFVRKWQRFVVTDNDNGTWTASSPLAGVIEMLDSESFQITTDTAVYLNATTYTIESTEKNEEDIWLS